MPAPRFKPFLAVESSTSDEITTLELFLKKQLEEDVARIFDESIYSDFEVVCGKSKILTHSCILKARTIQFYHKLEAILHVNIDHKTFDEIYSYISDVYTECDIKNQEKQILSYLKNNLRLSDVKHSGKIKEDVVDSDIFHTPKCLSPYIEYKFEPVSCLSPSVDLTKQYYALVPGNLEQELIEQDALSNAFKTIIETQDNGLTKIVKRSKPSSLPLSSSHSSQIKRSNSCDILNKISQITINKINTSQPIKPLDTNIKNTETSENCCDVLADKVDQAYSPDSLIADDPSSSSDYLSAAHTFSPGLSSIGGFPHLNVGDNITKAENIFNSSDSGFDNTGMMESMSSHKDVTLTDLSMTESEIMPLDINETQAATAEHAESYYLMTRNASKIFTNSNKVLNETNDSTTPYMTEESESDVTIKNNETPPNLRKTRYNESTPILSGGALLGNVDSLKSVTQPNSPSIRRKVDNIPIVTGTYLENSDNNVVRKSPKPNTSSAWVIDLTDDTFVGEKKDHSLNKPSDRTCESLKCNNSENSKSRSSVDSDCSEKSSHKFYIDFSSIPDPLPQEKKVKNDNVNEKKNMFSMYIDFDNSSTIKEKPRRLNLGTRKNTSDVKMNTEKLAKMDTNQCKTTDSNVKTDNAKSTFEMYESLCNNLHISISEIIAESSNASLVESCDHKILETVEESHDPNLKKNVASVIHEEKELVQSADEFVKLSDLDRPCQKPEIADSGIFESKKNYDDRMTRSIPDNNWRETGYTITSKSIEVISSFHSENALSLNRLFPHLKNEFSKSMPITFSGRTRSPFKSGVPSITGEIDEQTSDVSEISSVQSSMCRSVIENSTTEDTSQSSNIIGNSQSRLGQDLLRMFLEEIAPDVIVEVSGKRIKAHKCILSSRCQYFAGILSGGWVESAGNIIVLPPFSYNVVHFALCHIYSGLSTIPDSISIVELATIADMLGLEGLKEAIMYTLKSKYCHHFHTPCQVCTAGVLECFPLSSVYGLDDLYRKCLRWITKHFSIVWPTKAFATLPKELLDKCYLEHLNNFKTESVLETVYGCGITVASLHNTRWSEIVENMCRRLINAVAQFLAKNLLDFFKLIAAAPSDAPDAAKHALDNCVDAAIEWAPPEEICRSYGFLSNVVAEIKTQHYQPDLITNSEQMWKTLDNNSLLYNSATRWRLQCESALVRAAPRVVSIQAFKELPPDLRKRLRELGCIMYGPQIISTSSHERKSKGRNCKLSNASASRSLDMEKVRASFVPYKAKPTNFMGSIDEIKSNNEFRDSKNKAKKVPPKIRTTKAQEERAKYNQSKSRNHVPSKQTMTGPHNFQYTKPRYLEPKVRKDKEKKSPIQSSSESSRNSSPIKSKNTRYSRLESKRSCEHRLDAISQDSLASTSRPRTAEPSTDSLSESQISNKYATYTKAKHKIKGSVEQIPLASNVQGLSHIHTHVKTKIPIYVNQKHATNNGSKPLDSVKPMKNYHISGHTSSTSRTCLGNSPRSNNRTHESRKLPNIKSASMCNSLPLKESKVNIVERKASRSLMNATKSSSAKIVPKTTKDVPATKKPTKVTTNKTQKNGRHDMHNNNSFKNSSNDIQLRQVNAIPALERSSTFSKDEPTFENKIDTVDPDKN